MTRAEIREFLILKVREIQEKSGRPVPGELGDETKPIGGLPGFDSLNSAELEGLLCERIELKKGFHPCVSEDGKRALRIREIVDRLVEVAAN